MRCTAKHPQNSSSTLRTMVLVRVWCCVFFHTKLSWSSSSQPCREHRYAAFFFASSPFRPNTFKLRNMRANTHTRAPRVHRLGRCRFVVDDASASFVVVVIIGCAASNSFVQLCMYIEIICPLARQQSHRSFACVYTEVARSRRLRMNVCRFYFSVCVCVCICWPSAQWLCIDFIRSHRISLRFTCTVLSLAQCSFRFVVIVVRSFESCMSVFIARFSLSATTNSMCFKSKYSNYKNFLRCAICWLTTVSSHLLNKWNRKKKTVKVKERNPSGINSPAK